MAETRETLVQHYREMRARFLLAIDGLDDARLTEPSIDGWSVKDHMLHIAFWDGLRAGAFAAYPPATKPPGSSMVGMAS